MELNIRFLRLEDGARIAFATLGIGPALVFTPAFVTHIGATWDNPAYKQNLESLGQAFTVVLYDRWGNGLSDRTRTDWSLATEVRTLGAVAKSLALDRFGVVGISDGGPAAILYASQNPLRVSYLVLFGTFCHRPELDRPTFDALLTFIRGNWGMASGALAGMFVPDLDPDHLKWFLRLEREGADGDSVARMGAMESLADVTVAAEGLLVPTLVLHRREDAVVPFERGVELAGIIPGARFVPLQGEQHYWFRGNAQAIIHAIKDFAGLAPSLEVEVPQVVSGGIVTFRTILFTDLEGHTAMMSRLGDAKGREVLREHERLTRESLAAHGGTEVKAMGDGFMASFGSAQKALECAIALQRSFSELGTRNSELPRVRVGINAGEPIAEDDDLFGASVIAAARIAAKAEGGQVLVSDVVRQLVAGKGFLFSDTGEHILKGMEEPVRVWRLRWEPLASA